MVLAGRARAGAERPGVRREAKRDTAFPGAPTPDADQTGTANHDSKAPDDGRTPEPDGEAAPTLRLLRMKLVGAYPGAAITGEDELPGSFNTPGHGGAATMLFADGHQESARPPNWIVATVRRRWNNDHEPDSESWLRR